MEMLTAYATGRPCAQTAPVLQGALSRCQRTDRSAGRSPTSRSIVVAARPPAGAAGALPRPAAEWFNAISPHRTPARCHFPKRLFRL